VIEEKHAREFELMQLAVKAPKTQASAQRFWQAELMQASEASRSPTTGTRKGAVQNSVQTVGVGVLDDPRGTNAHSYNEYRMAKSQKAFRRATLWRSKTAQLFCRIFIAMSIGRMIQGIIRCQTCRLAAKSIESSIDFAIR